jgi:hypothetical protein
MRGGERAGVGELAVTGRGDGAEPGRSRERGEEPIGELDRGPQERAAGGARRVEAGSPVQRDGGFEERDGLLARPQEEDRPGGRRRERSSDRAS